MSWADNDTDVEKLLRAIRDILDALSGAILIGSTGIDAAAWNSMNILIGQARIKIGEMQSVENIRRIKANQILNNIDEFLRKLSKLQ